MDKLFGRRNTLLGPDVFSFVSWSLSFDCLSLSSLSLCLSLSLSLSLSCVLHLLPLSFGQVWDDTPDDKRDLLGPCQYAFNRPGAAKSAVHAVRAALAASDSSILISCDIEQAYSSRSRASVLRELVADRRFSKIAPLFLFKYTAPTQLLLYKGDILVDVVLQRDGVTQGDLTGTWDFCASVAPIASAMQSRHPDAKLMDANDINIVRPPAAAFALVTDLSVSLQKEGLSLKLPKCFAL